MEFIIHLWVPTARPPPRPHSTRPSDRLLVKRHPQTDGASAVTIRNRSCMHLRRPGYSRTRTGSADAASDTPDRAEQHHPSNPIKLGTCTVRSPDGSKPLVMEFEARVATGKASEALA